MNAATASSRRSVRIPLYAASVGLAAVGMILLTGSCLSAKPTPELLDAARDLTTDRPVFRGAEGFGTNTPAGRGGAVIRVTSLASDGPGSLREALAQAGPRVVVFEVGGVIDTVQSLDVTEPFVTVAGQTAPSPGITVTGAGIVVCTHDVLVQHLRFRVGDRPEGPDPGGRDGITVTSNEGSRECYNVVLDHCSISWALDEGMSTWGAGVRDVTFRQCISAENLSHSLHPEGEHSKGLLIGDHSKRIAVIGNLFADNMRRNPFVKGDVSALIVNNLIYNPGSAAIHFGDIEGSGASLGTVVGNVMRAGLDTQWLTVMIALLVDMNRETRVYLTDNDPTGRKLRRAVISHSSWRDIKSVEESPLHVAPLMVRPSSEVAAWVLANAGARPADRDAVDKRIVADVEAGTGRIIDSPTDVGGLPEVTPTQRALVLPDDPSGDADGDGYTNLEAWLGKCAAEVEGRP